MKKILFILGIIILFGISWVIWNHGSEVFESAVTQKEALQTANNNLPRGCSFNYDKIEKVNWNPNSPASSVLQKNICPKIENYEEEEMWKTKKEISKNIIAVSFVGTSLMTSGDCFICNYAQDRRAAPGIKELKDICATSHTTNYPYQPREVASNFLTCYLKRVETPEDFLKGVKGCEQYLQEEYKQKLLNREASTDPVFWSGDQLPAKEDIKLKTTEKKKSTATVRISFLNLWPNHYVEMSLILVEGNWKIESIWPLE